MKYRREEKNTNLVYSTESGRSEKPAAKKQRKKKKRQAVPPTFKNDGAIRVRRELKGRGGKTVTTIFGAPFEGEALKDFAKGIKQHCGTGGSVKDSVIIIQGDHCDKIIAYLQSQGYTAKKAGG